MNHEIIEKERIIDRYVMGQLSAEESERFEEHYFACPACFEQLELTEALQKGLEQNAAEEAASAIDRRAIEVGLLAWIASRGRLVQSTLLALVFAAIIAPPIFLGQRLRQTEDALFRARQPQINTPILTLSPERDASTANPSQRVRLPASPGWLVLALELTLADHATYRASLLDSHENLVWQGDELRPNAFDTLTLNIHSSSLSAGDYILNIEGVTPDHPGSVIPFTFRVLAAD